MALLEIPVSGWTCFNTGGRVRRVEVSNTEGLTLVDVGRVGLLSGALALLLVAVSARGSGLLGGPKAKVRNAQNTRVAGGTHFFAAFAPSVDLAGALPAVEAGAFWAVEAGLGGMAVKCKRMWATAVGTGCERAKLRKETKVHEPRPFSSPRQTRDAAELENGKARLAARDGGYKRA